MHVLTRSALCCALVLPLTAASAASIEVRVAPVAGGKGTVNVAVCDKERFLKQCLYTASAPAQEGETVIVIEDVPAGAWAVLAYQDENGNKQLDRNVLGIPKEKYGFSREARGRFGPPHFAEAALVVREGLMVVPVRLR
ncbi:DUF2141 domain-containing protein [Massilia niastensis]|uniref:DUF2141 domain-containing protein n=1 Tax=Massilia niastensis TaxID=544911 RepID=UPI0003A81452|nr:DUF2141 domain-containing protein [Massilia niastensis]